MGKEIRVAVAGVGNCCSSLVQGRFYYKNVDSNDEAIPGLMHNVLGGYKIKDIKFVAAFDVDKRKVGRDLSEAIFAKPNCTKIFCKDVPKMGVTVQKGPVLDGVASHMLDYPEDQSFRVDEKSKPVNVADELKKAKADVLVNYMPVGSQQATEYYANACLEAGVAFINCMPVFIVSNADWAKKFKEKGIPAVGCDVKSQCGATIVHRVLTKLFTDRGIKLDRTYQLNTGGNSVTGDQDILFLVNGELKRVSIGKFIDSYIDIYGKRNETGKDIVTIAETAQEIKCFTIDSNYNTILSDVSAFIRHEISEPLYEITTEEGRKIKITKDHNVFTLDNDGNLKEIPIRLLKENETYLAVPKNLNCYEQKETEYIDLTSHIGNFPMGKAIDGYLNVHSHPEIKIPLNFPITDELLQIIGLWLADGNFDRNGSSNIELACGDEPECMEILDKFAGSFNINYSVRKDKIGVRIVSKTLGRIFKLALGLGGDCYTKRVPEWVFNLSQRQIALVLKGYLSGDGGVTGKQIRWTSVSEGLIKDIQTMFLLIGIKSNIFKENYIANKGYHSNLGHIWHGLISSKENMESFIGKVGFLQESKNMAAMNAYGALSKYNIHRIPNISLLKKYKIKSTTWYKHSSIRAHIVLSQLDKIKDETEKEKIKRICEGDAHFLKIKQIKQINCENQYVYDISTKPFERFICSNILVHNTDFLNMLERNRLKSKKISKTEAVQSQLPTPLDAENIHIGPSDYVPWQKDNKLCFIRMEGRKFGDVPIHLDLKLSVEDSPNSAGVVIDAIRCAKLALDRKIGGALISISAYTMKHPPVQYPDNVAKEMVEEFIAGTRER